MEIASLRITLVQVLALPVSFFGRWQLSTKQVYCHLKSSDSIKHESVTGDFWGCSCQHCKKKGSHIRIDDPYSFEHLAQGGCLPSTEMNKHLSTVVDFLKRNNTSLKDWLDWWKTFYCSCVVKSFGFRSGSGPGFKWVTATRFFRDLLLCFGLLFGCTAQWRSSCHCQTGGLQLLFKYKYSGTWKSFWSTPWQQDIQELLLQNKPEPSLLCMEDVFALVASVCTEACLDSVF